MRLPVFSSNALWGELGWGGRLLQGIVTLVLLTGPAQGEPLTFDQAVEGMKVRNEALMAAQDDIHQREEERAAAKGLRYPKVEIELEHLLLDKPISIGIEPIPVSLQVQSDRFTKGEITATLPLYTGGKIDAANQAAEANHAEACAQGRNTEYQLVSELAQRYFGLCLAQRNRDVQRLKADAMGQHAYRSRRLMDEGMIARVEHLNAEVAVANARQELDAAEHDVKIVSEALSNIVVKESLIEPSSPLFMLHEIEPREAFQGFVNEDHPILLMLAAKRKLVQQGVKAEKAADKPLVYLFGMHELVPKDLTMLDPEWVVGLGVQYTLFDGFQGKHKVEAMRAQEQKVVHLQQKIQRDLKTLVVKRYEEMEKARAQYDAFASTLDLTRENLRVRTRAFEEGLATSLEVVDAVLSQARAELGRYKAAFDFDLALFQLLEASGRTETYKEYLARGEAVPEPATPKTEESPPLEGVEKVLTEK